MTNLIGQQLGKYRLTHLLGRGGFADVYLGEHIHLARPVAIKILHERLIANDLNSFRQEAQMIASLKHPNIINIFDFDIDANGTPFLVMDYLPAGNILTVHPRGQLMSLKDVVPFTMQVALALQHAHDARIIHRDVKPENLLLGSHQKIILSDFGIAVAAHGTASMEMQNVIGTPRYMAPEQFRGYPTPASDQYALGIIVYEWLCGECPFLGANFIEMGMKHASDPVPSLRQKVPMLSPEVEQVVLTALAKEPQQRFNNMQAFATALEQASGWTPSKSTATTLPPTLPPEQPRPTLRTDYPALPIVPSTSQTRGTLPVPNAAFTFSQPIPALHTPNLAFSPLQVSSNIQAYEKTHPCPLCSQIDRIEKVSALAVGDIFHWSSFLTYSRATRTEYGLKLSREMQSLTNSASLYNCIAVASLIVFLFLSGIVPITIAANGWSLSILTGIFLIAIFCGITVVMFLLASPKNKQLKQEIASRQAQAYALWDRLYYCARDDIVFVPGEPARQIKPLDMQRNILQEYYSK